MYKIEKRPSGYILRFAGAMDAEELRRWIHESEDILNKETSSSFGVIIDMRQLKPLSFDAGKLIKQGQDLYRKNGMHRSAVLLSSPEICAQFKNIAVQSGIYSTERYIDASSAEDPQEAAIQWVKNGVEPG